jgi:hypothetical protein
METKLKLLVDTSSKLIDDALYRQIIGSLMYLTNTTPDICFVVNTLSQFLVEPRRVHLVVAKHVTRYLKGTLDCGLSYNADHDFRLSAYTDLDVKISDPNPVSVLLIFQPKLNAQTQFQHSFNI